MQKICPMCGKTKPHAEFAKDSTKASGLQSKCRVCFKLVRQLRREQDQEKQRERRRNNAEANRAACRQYYRKNRGAQLVRMKKYRECTNNEAQKRWAKANPEEVRAKNQQRRSRLKGAEGSYTVQQWTERCEEYDSKCAYCRKRRKLTVHHVKPLSKGGSNYIDNIVPACGSCNSRIGTKEIWPEAQPC